MGYSISWVAVKGSGKDEFLDLLGLSATGEMSCVPDEPIVGLPLPSGWFLVWANDTRFAETASLDSLSSDGEIVACVVEEHVMWSYAEGWSKGKQLWSVRHSSDLGIDHLETIGDPPVVFQDICERLTAEQAKQDSGEPKVDYIFDIPVELAEAVTGFSYNKLPPGTTDDDEPWETLGIVGGGFVSMQTTNNKGCLLALLTIPLGLVR